MVLGLLLHARESVACDVAAAESRIGPEVGDRAFQRHPAPIQDIGTVGELERGGHILLGSCPRSALPPAGGRVCVYSRTPTEGSLWSS